MRVAGVEGREAVQHLVQHGAQRPPVDGARVRLRGEVGEGGGGVSISKRDGSRIFLSFLIFSSFSFELKLDFLPDFLR